jgi:hypothetical protein
MAPPAAQRAALQEHGGTNPRPVLDGVSLDIENKAGFHVFESRAFRGVIDERWELDSLNYRQSLHQSTMRDSRLASRGPTGITSAVFRDMNHPRP